MSGECKTNGKNNYPCALTDKAVSNKSTVIIRKHYSWLPGLNNYAVDGGGWEPGFLLQEWKVTGKQEGQNDPCDTG